MKNPPNADEIATLHRWFAIECNNRAWTLTEQAERTAGEDDELLAAAHTSAFHWRAIGTERQRALADVLLARTHALLNHPALALRYAGRAHAYFTAHESEPWESAFAEAVMAHAAAVAGRPEEHAAHHARAAAIGANLDPEDRRIFLATFDRLPAPAHAAARAESETAL